MIAALALAATQATAPAAWVAVGDGIPEPLGGLQGDATRGAALVADRGKSLCLLCHQAAVQGPHAPAALQGTPVLSAQELEDIVAWLETQR